MQNSLVEHAIQAFAQWREKRVFGKERIPEELLKIAVALSEEIGRSQTVKKLGIGWYRLAEAREQYLPEDTSAPKEVVREASLKPAIHSKPKQMASQPEPPKPKAQVRVSAASSTRRCEQELQRTIAVTKIVSTSFPNQSPKAQESPPVELISPGGWTIRLDPESTHARALGHSIVMEILQHERGTP